MKQDIENLIILKLACGVVVRYGTCYNVLYMLLRFVEGRNSDMVLCCLQHLTPIVVTKELFNPVHPTLPPPYDSDTLRVLPIITQKWETSPSLYKTLQVTMMMELMMGGDLCSGRVCRKR